MCEAVRLSRQQEDRLLMSRHQVQHVPDGAERTFLGLTLPLKPHLCVYAAADGAEQMMRQSEGGGKRENYMH